MKFYMNRKPWYIYKDNSFKVISLELKSQVNDLCTCVMCGYALISQVYQQQICGSRICSNCYNKIVVNYYCEFCKVDDPNNMLHGKENLFLDKAFENDNKMIKISCPDCNQKDLLLLDIENHVQNCEEKWIYCQLCNEMIMNKDSSKHAKCKNLKEDLKILMESQCPTCGQNFDELKNHVCNIDWSEGCVFGCKINLQENLEHREKEKLFHTDKALAIVKKNIDVNDKELNRNKLFLNITNQLKENLKYENIDFSIKELKSLTESIKHSKVIYHDLEGILMNQIEESRLTSYDGTILWKIENWKEVRDDAESGKHESIYSPCFYTSKFGYKLCLRLYPKGDSTAKDKGISLFLVIMKGSYDNLLKWPFKQKVTFILLDQEFKANHIDAFVPTENQASFSQPRTDMNIPSGSSYFIKNDDFKINSYVMNNSIFVRCIVDCSDLMTDD